MVSLQSIIWVFLLNNFSRVINLLLTKLARDRPGRISALGLFCTDLATLGPYCQDLGPIFSQYGPRAWLIRYIYSILLLLLPLAYGLVLETRSATFPLRLMVKKIFSILTCSVCVLLLLLLLFCTWVVIFFHKLFPYCKLLLSSIHEYIKN